MERSASLKKEKMTTTQMTVTALMTAVLCIFGPMVLPIPVSPVPISLTNLVLYFMVYILGMKASLMSFCLYLLLGAVGLPVFSGFAGGLGKLAGPTGGYLLGFVFMTLAAGFMVERFPDHAVLHHQIALLRDLQLPQRRGLHDVPLQNLHHIRFLPFRKK